MGSGITSFPSVAAAPCCCFLFYEVLLLDAGLLLEVIRIGNVRSWTAGIAQLLSAEWKVDFEGVYLCDIVWLCSYCCGFAIVGFLNVEAIQLTAQTRRPFE